MTEQLAVPALELRNVSFAYPGVVTMSAVLRGVDLLVSAGEQVAIIGESGSGKSTLLHLAGGLERPTSGTVRLAGEDMGGLNEQARTLLRQRRLGIVFQAFHLIPTLTALENVALPLELAGRLGVREAREAARERLRAVGLETKLERFPEQLSGGEQQRVAIARAVVHQPALILADEPTGNLDSRTGEAVFGLLVEQVRETRCALLMVTHSEAIARRMDRVLVMRDGRILGMDRSGSTREPYDLPDVSVPVPGPGQDPRVPVSPGRGVEDGRGR